MIESTRARDMHARDSSRFLPKSILESYGDEVTLPGILKSHHDDYVDNDDNNNDYDYDDNADDGDERTASIIFIPFTQLYRHSPVSLGSEQSDEAWSISW